MTAKCGADASVICIKDQRNGISDMTDQAKQYPDYQPFEYWNAREHPNISDDDDVGLHDSEFIRPQIKDAKTLLEIGPGVGRLFKLYTHLDKVYTVDISTNYSDRLRAKATSFGISLEDHYLPDATAPFPFVDQQFDCGMASFVLMHIPFENIEHTMSEAARVCKKMVVFTSVEDSWPKARAEYNTHWHCFNHDYNAICERIGCEIVHHEKITERVFGFVYQRR
ncbi:MAG: class I SAM-dependent methyltransferase [Pseudomonadota bacterium]